MNKTNNTLKPEYVLKRANDLINSAVGANADKEKRMALDQLHTFISTKKHKVTWNKSFEPVMRKHLELCVDLKDHLTAKDGLHQYRNLCVHIDHQSFEAVIIYLLDLSEARAANARQKADKVALAAAARVADLDQGESPESIMLSSMTEEGSKERTDREVVVPWLRFLWENFRAILEVLYRLPKLEKCYHKTCEKAFKFCLDYSRKMEFRRLCETLRMQLTNLQRPNNAMGGNKLMKPNYEWTPESIELHLQTRFLQLEAATALELWNESFRTIEDINSIMYTSKKTPKGKLMVTYYEKLTRIFSVSDNKLFHAYSMLKLYEWNLETRKDIKPEEKAALASAVLLSALSIPSTKDYYLQYEHDGDKVGAGAPEDDPITHFFVDKYGSWTQLAVLLDFPTSTFPSRQSLLNEIAERKIVEEVFPDIQGTYDLLEKQFQPLLLIKKVSNSLAFIKQQANLQYYYTALLKIIVLKVIQQLSKVYSVMKLSFLHTLFRDISDISGVFIEKIIIDGINQKQIFCKINHLNNTISFTAQAASVVATTVPGNTIDTQLTKLGNSLHSLFASVQQKQQTLEQQQIKDKSRKQFLSVISAALDKEFVAYQDRKVYIERRKENMERIQVEKLREMEEQKRIEEERRLEEEKARLALEEQRRQDEKLRKQQEKLEVIKLQQKLEAFGINKDENELLEMGAVARNQLLLNAQAKAQQAKEDENRRFLEQGKKKDYLERAYRIESVDKVLERQEKQRLADEKLRDEKVSTIVAEWKVKHDAALAERDRLAKMQNHRKNFETPFLSAQQNVYEQGFQQYMAKKMREKREELLAKARLALDEELERLEREAELERERLAKEERDRLESEQYERLRKQREKEEELERERDAKLERMRREIAEAEAKKEAEEQERKAAAVAAEEESKPKKYVPPTQRAATAAPSSTPSKSSGGGWERATGRSSGGRDEWRGGGDRGAESRGPPASNDRWGSDRGDRGSDNRGPPASNDRWGSDRGDRGSDNRGPPASNDRWGSDRGGDRNSDSRGPPPSNDRWGSRRDNDRAPPRTGEADNWRRK